MEMLSNVSSSEGNSESSQDNDGPPVKHPQMSTSISTLISGEIHSNLSSGYSAFCLCNSSSISESKELQYVSTDIPTELYKYKVVYPGGTFVRISPNIDAERAGGILEYGTVIVSTKSIMLDGINYVKITEPDGWVFENKNGTQVLELIDCIRLSPQIHESISSSNLNNNEWVTLSKARHKKSKLFHLLRAESRYWRLVRSMCSDCTTFEEFLKISQSLEKQPPERPESGPARVVWMELALQNQDQLIRTFLSRITAITKHSAENVSIEGLEASLWVLVHLGGKASHILNLAVQRANQKFEDIDDKRRLALLSVVLDVGARTRPLAVELARLASVDLLPDDLRNFLQRWVIIMFSLPPPPPPPSSLPSIESTNTNIDDVNGCQTTESSISTTTNNNCNNDSNNLLDVTSYLNLHSTTTTSSQNIHNILPKKTPVSGQSTFSFWTATALCLSKAVSCSERESDRLGVSGSGSGSGSESSWLERIKNRLSNSENGVTASQFWKEVEQQMRIISDPNIQYARLI